MAPVSGPYLKALHTGDAQHRMNHLSAHIGNGEYVKEHLWLSL